MTTIENPMGTQPIKKLLMQLAIPAMIANVVNALYNIVDQIFIGQGVGYLGNAATNIAFPITTICLALGLMTGVINRDGNCSLPACSNLFSTINATIWSNRSNF